MKSLFIIILLNQDFTMKIYPFFSWAAELISSPFPSCSVQEQVTAVKALITKKQGREIVMVCARRSHLDRAGADCQRVWVLIRHQRPVLRFGIGE
jgi:hypothetical protein